MEQTPILNESTYFGVITDKKQRKILKIGNQRFRYGIFESPFIIFAMYN